MKNKTIAIVQCRFGSTRLPHKALLCLNGKPLAEWVYSRLAQAKYLDDIIFAIPDNAENEILYRELTRLGVVVFAGQEEDVFGRMLSAAQAYGADNFVRICADNPLVTGSEIDRLIEHFNTIAPDYAYNHIPQKNQYPDGIGGEICKTNLLQKVYDNLPEGRPDLREHMFLWLSEKPDAFTRTTFDPDDEALFGPQFKFDIDTLLDYQYLSRLGVTLDSSFSDIMYRAKNDAKIEKKP